MSEVFFFRAKRTFAWEVRTGVSYIVGEDGENVVKAVFLPPSQQVGLLSWWERESQRERGSAGKPTWEAHPPCSGVCTYVVCVCDLPDRTEDREALYKG